MVLNICEIPKQFRKICLKKDEFGELNQQSQCLRNWEYKILKTIKRLTKIAKFRGDWSGTKECTSDCRYRKIYW